VTRVDERLPFGINDADNHFVEPEDMYERYIAPKYRDKAVRFVRDAQGRRIQLYGSRPSKLAFTRESAPQTPEELERLAATAGPRTADESQPKPGDGGARSPGMFLNRLNPYRNLGKEERKALMQRFKSQEAAWGDRDLRLALMDEQGIHAAIMFPGHVLNLEFEFADDVDAIHANAEAYNRWIHAEVGHGHEGRMFLPPYVALADVDLAVKEVDRLIAEGARLIEIVTGHAHGGRANPRGGRSLADPVFDPFWARVDEAGVRIATHVGPTDYQKYGADLSEDPEAVLRDFGGLQWALFWGDRPAMDTVASLIMHNLFGRFPNVRVCLSEQGTVWLPYLLRKLDATYFLGRGARWGKLDRRPSEIFREHFVVAPFPEENVQRVVAEVGIEPIVFGSDFPHAEGLAFPGQYVAAQLAGMPEAQVLAIMRDNLANFLGIAA
jgi:predicted TIM-barrel fold metal-dependent hydrolase